MFGDPTKKSLFNTVHHSSFVVIDKAKFDGCIRVIRLSVTGFSLCIAEKKKEAKDNASTRTPNGALGREEEGENVN